MPRSRGFTLIEVLVVISLLALLISILSPSLAQGRRNARMAVCISGLHQFGIAWTSYVDDSMGVLMGSSTNRLKYDWVYTNAPTESEIHLKTGTMYPYARDTKLYRCPDDPRPDYLRSYSMSNYLGGLPGWGIVPAIKQHQLHKQDQTMMLIEEPDPRGFNQGSWVIHPKGSPSAGSWIDWAGSFHNQGTTISYADCHAEYIGWRDPRTPAIQWFYAATPNNPDLVRMQEAYTP